MTTFFRKRPPYTPRSEHTLAHEDDFPVIGPASESIDESDYPLLEAETESVDDFPIVGPAAEEYHKEEDEEELPVAIPIAAGTAMPTANKVTPRQFTPSNKLQFPQAPDWVQEQAHSSNNTISPQLENAIKVIINDEMEQAEKRIQQRVLNELKNHL